MSREINSVLFDIGGVLMPDSMQAILFTPKAGLVDVLGLDVNKSFTSSRIPYDKYKHGGLDGATEENFWSDFAKEVGVNIPFHIVEEVKKQLIKPNPTATATLKYLTSRNIEVGIVSNNTDFWYAEANKTLDLDSYINVDLIFLSNELKETKPTGLIDKAAKSVKPQEALYIDDRSDNIYLAKYYGFQVLQYSMQNSSPTLEEYIKELVG